MTLVEMDDSRKLEIIEALVFDDDDANRSFERLQVQIKKLLLCAKFFLDSEESFAAVMNAMDVLDTVGSKEGIC